jgi:hypothetical protein
MAELRKHLPPKIKMALIREAGRKCANPGCANYRTHLHHIREWAVYQTHDQDHMLAICPTCHDEVHHGKLIIDDDTIYAWKRIKREPTNRDHIYVEPGDPAKLLLGTVTVVSENDLFLFSLSKANQLNFRVVDNDIVLLNLTISTSSGREVLRVVEGHVRHAVKKPLKYDRRPGRIRITAPTSADFIPTWALQGIRNQEPTYGENNLMALLDLEVLGPGLVRVEGIWLEGKRAIIVTRERLSYIQEGMLQPKSLVGFGLNTVLQCSGLITTAVFGIQDGYPSVLQFDQGLTRP